LCEKESEIVRGSNVKPAQKVSSNNKA